MAMSGLVPRAEYLLETAPATRYLRCSVSCRRTFLAPPGQFAAPQATFRGRYGDRLPLLSQMVEVLAHPRAGRGGSAGACLPAQAHAVRVVGALPGQASTSGGGRVAGRPDLARDALVEACQVPRPACRKRGPGPGRRRAAGPRPLSGAPGPGSRFPVGGPGPGHGVRRVSRSRVEPMTRVHRSPLARPLGALLGQVRRASASSSRALGADGPRPRRFLPAAGRRRPSAPVHGPG